jgi:DNA-binding transcriptional regulator LsrR (DeoR family)
MVMARAPLDPAKKVAMVLLTEAGVHQADIAHRFGVTQSTVSRVIKQAERRGELRRTAKLEKSAIDPEVLRRAQDIADDPPAIQERLTALAGGGKSHHPVTVRILAPAGARRSTSDQDDRTRLFGHAAAPRVLELLKGGVEICGVTWGHSIGAVVEGIEAMVDRPKRGGAELRFVPLCGDPLGPDAASLYSSSVLAERLGSAMGVKGRENLSLAMLPAFLPGDFTGAEVNAVWKLIGKMHSYTDVFGGRQNRAAAPGSGRPASTHYAGRLDMILTGISAAGQPLGDGRGPLFESGGLKEDTFKQLVLADVGGVMIERGQLSRGQKSTLSRLKARWTGLSESELRGCAERAACSDARHRPPGVVVMALGRKKAEPLRAAVERRLVNHLLIDAELAEELALRTQ